MLLEHILRLLHRSNVLGKSRLTIWAAERLPKLRAVPIQISDWAPVYMDLRRYDAHEWFRGSPWTSSPREIAEQTIMAKLVRAGDVVYDIGANIGLHTALLSRLVGPSGRVFAFEPNPQVLHVLRRTIAGMSNTTLIECGLGDEDDTTDMYVPDADQSTASLRDWTQGKIGERAVCRIEVRRLDALGLPAPDFIKCDIEGGEVAAFKGGSNILNREDGPIVLFEANVHTQRGFGLPVTAPREFLNSLSAARFTFFEVGEAGQITRLTHMNEVHSNIIAVPAGRMDRVSTAQVT